MFWFVSDDKYYYENIDTLKKENKLSKIIVLPEHEEIKEQLLSIEKVGFLSPKLPNKKLYGNIFVIKRLANRYQELTSQEKKADVNIKEALEIKLGIEIISPDVLPKMSDMAGNKGFIEWFKNIDRMFIAGKKIKPIAFVGMAGCGKSRGAEAIAGEWNVPLIDLHIPTILEADDPYEMLRDILRYLHTSKLKCVVRMDEMEQMLHDPGMMAELLKQFNNLNTLKGYNINGLVIGTANNISDLMKKVSQFFRHGRWNEKFFVSFPNESETIAIMKYYFEKYKVNFLDSFLKEQKDIFKVIYIEIDEVYSKYNIAANEGKAVYAPSEIDYLFLKLSEIKKIDSLNDIKKVIDYVKPQQLTASEGTLEMYADCKKLGFKDLNEGY